MNKENREKTNSITYLVKIVAQEVYKENFKQEGIHQEVCKIRKELDELKIKSCKDYFDIFVNYKIDVTNKGRSWTDFEDRLLKREIECALKKIANNHKRSDGAIRSRINQKELILN